MELVDPEDEPSAFHEPPLPDDRLWRHPSELAPHLPTPGYPMPGGGQRESGGLDVTRRHRDGPSTWAVVGVTALVASLVSAGLVVAVVGRTGGSPSSDVAVERQMVRPRTVSTVSASPAVDMAERLRPAIVQLKVQTAGGSSIGSGVVFRSDGHILTNAHVVESATAIAVAMANGRELAARLVGTDPETDTAVVKLDGGPYPVATLGTAADLRVGQTAMAMGFPLGVAGGPSVAGGMVSALHREVTATWATNSGRSALVDMIQTDAPMSPGSSGGALLDANGAVIGITSPVTAAEAGGAAFGFATTIDVARSVADELIRTGRVLHSWLGIEGGDLDATTSLEMNVEGGAMVAEVTDAGPAQRAGLVTRDVIVAFDGHAVASMGDLVMALRSHTPGEAVVVKVVRDGRTRSVTVTLVERPATS